MWYRLGKQIYIIRADCSLIFIRVFFFLSKKMHEIKVKVSLTI